MKRFGEKNHATSVFGKFGDEGCDMFVEVAAAAKGVRAEIAGDCRHRFEKMVLI